MKIEHNSRNEFYRTPFGAVTDKQSVCIRLGISGGGIPNSVTLVYWNADKEIKKLNPEKYLQNCQPILGKEF